MKAIAHESLGHIRFSWAERVILHGGNVLLFSTRMIGAAHLSGTRQWARVRTDIRIQGHCRGLSAPGNAELQVPLTARSLERHPCGISAKAEDLADGIINQFGRLGCTFCRAGMLATRAIAP